MITAIFNIFAGTISAGVLIISLLFLACAIQLNDMISLPMGYIVAIDAPFVILSGLCLFINIKEAIAAIKRG